MSSLSCSYRPLSLFAFSTAEITRDCFDWSPLIIKLQLQFAKNSNIFIFSFSELLYVYCIISRYFTQSFYLQLTYTLRYCSTVWFIHSICLSVCRWNTVEHLCLISNCAIIVCQNFEIYISPLSEIITSGIPCVVKIIL